MGYPSRHVGFNVRSIHGTTANQSPLDETGAWASKLDAAKDLLLRQASSLRAHDIAVLVFTDSYKKIFQGSRDEFLGHPELIRDLTAEGGTSIAAALEGVRVDTAFERYRSISVLALSDGLSDMDSAAQAAEALIARYEFARIDTILIDETPEGRRVAESISLNGTVRVATSSIQLGNAISEARLESLRGELSNMPMMRYLVQNELSSAPFYAPPTLLTNDRTRILFDCGDFKEGHRSDNRGD